MKILAIINNKYKEVRIMNCDDNLMAQSTIAVIRGKIQDIRKYPCSDEFVLDMGYRVQLYVDLIQKGD